MSTFKTQCSLELHGVKQKQEQCEQGQSELVPGSGLEALSSDHKLWDRPEVPQGVGKAVLGAAGHLLLLLVLPVEHSDWILGRQF